MKNLSLRSGNGPQRAKRCILWLSNLFIFKRRGIYISLEGCSILNSGLSLRVRGRGSAPAAKNMAPSYFHRKMKKNRTKRNLAV